MFGGHNAGDSVTIWEPTNDQFGVTQVGVLEAVQFIPTGIAFSPDGTRIFVVGDGNQLHVFDYATLQPMGQPAGLNLNPIAIAATSDGTRLLASDGQSLSVIVPSGVSGGVGG
jgi:DNA-binding beta-propeller fold protein YncE